MRNLPAEARQEKTVRLGELISDITDDILLNLTGADSAYWAGHFESARRIARMSGAVRRGQLFTSNQMFGIVIDGRYIQRGWKQKLGLDVDEIKVVQVNVTQNELTDHEQKRQEEAGRSPKNKTATGKSEIGRVSRYIISDSFFEPQPE